MDELLDAILFLLHWRISLSTIGSIIAAVLLSNTFLEFTAGYCVTLVIVSFAFGILWEIHAERQAIEKLNQQKGRK